MFILPKLYANTVYMVLNSQIRIMGGRDTYAPSSDMMELSTTLMVDLDPPPNAGHTTNGRGGKTGDSGHDN